MPSPLLHPARDEPPVSKAAARALEADASGLTMDERLVRAAGRLLEPPALPGAWALRHEQARVFDDFATYLTDLATRPPGQQGPPFCRIVQPPRTGKTVVAGHIIDRTGLTATFIVPTRTLLEQTVRELSRQLPGVAIGSYYGEVKQVARHGVNVVTYAMLQKSGKEGQLPRTIRDAALVLVDEAHHAMSPARMAHLRQAFDPLAVRVALTATPDYDEERTLCRHFPDLVHEITLEEALDLELLAPLRVWVAEVDADASRVRFLASDYDLETLGRLMSTAPFFRAAEVFRYHPDSAALPCLIACASRQQAHDLHQYLAVHRPAGRPAPRLVLGDTPPDERRCVLDLFERGEIDTLIQVGVLVEGWNSPRCKLLLDLAPSASRVRATQKYFRVMTRHAGAEARIFVLLPRDLPALPILPMELFGRSLDAYECGALVGRDEAAGAGSPPLDRLTATPVEGVHLRKRIVLEARLEKPALDPRRLDDVRAVLASNPAFDPEEPPAMPRFRGLLFQHRLFFGRGDFLLRWLGGRFRREDYAAFLARLYPGTGADHLLLAEDGTCHRDIWCAADREHFEAALLDARRSEGWQPEEPFPSTYRALTGAPTATSESPEDLLLSRELATVVETLISHLPKRKRRILIARFGLGGQPPCTLDELGALEDICRERARSLVATALRTLRKVVLRPELREYFGPLTREVQVERARKDAAARLAESRVAETEASDEERIVDIDGRYRADAWDHENLRPVIRRVRRVAFVRLAHAGTLHIDHGALVTPCGRMVASAWTIEVTAEAFYRGRVPGPLCGTCMALRRPEVAAEMAALEARLR